MIQVTLCTLAAESYKPHLRAVRVRMFELVKARWAQEPQALVQTVLPEALSVDLRAFQRERRVWAEKRAREAQKGFYVVADDDCLPASMAPFLVKAVAVLAAYPEFAMLSLLPTNARIRPWRPGGEYPVHEDAEVTEHHDVGGIRVCRTGCLESWPEQERNGYDMEHCVALREAGYRVGYFRGLKMVHLGEGYSTVW